MNAIPVLVEKKESCCGCSACYAICPKRAITMVEDEKGFLYPHINAEVCVGCGLCIKVCPIKKDTNANENLRDPEIVAVKHKSVETRMHSSSGGFFSAISDIVLEKNGVVYGAEFINDFKVCHMRATTKSERDRFRGSKYVQSDLQGCFLQIKKDLDEGKHLLFSGTPCQVAGLYNYLRGYDVDKLITIDIICHGTPSPRIFSHYLDRMKNKYNSEIIDLDFRYKPSGWRSQSIRIVFENGQEYIAPALEDSFYRLFLHNIILRDSCYACKFTNIYRPSDITLGDFWGIEKSLPDFDDDKGVSLVLLNTEKGRELFDKTKSVIVYESTNTQNCMQHNLMQPSICPPKTQLFWSGYVNYGYEYVSNQFDEPKWKKEIKRILKKFGLINFLRKLSK